MKEIIFIFLSVLFLSVPFRAFANIDFHGTFLSKNFVFLLDSSEKYNFRSADIFKLSTDIVFNDQLSYSSVARIYYDNTLQSSLDLDFDEICLNYYWSSYAAKVGKQIFSFGFSDLISPTDIFNPVDYRYLTDYQKEGIECLELAYFIDDNSLSFMLVPMFRSSKLPFGSSNRWFTASNKILDPVSGSTLLDANYSLDGSDAPSPDFLKSPQYMLSWTSLNNVVDLRLFYYQGYLTVPSLFEETVTDIDYVNNNIDISLAPQFQLTRMLGINAAKIIKDVKLTSETGFFFLDPTDGIADSSSYVHLALGLNYSKDLFGKDSQVFFEYIRKLYISELSAELGINALFNNTLALRIITQVSDYYFITTDLIYDVGNGSIYSDLENKYYFDDFTIGSLGIEMFLGKEEAAWGQFSLNNNCYVKLERQLF